MSNACEDPGKKEEMDQKVDDLQEKWRDLHDNLNNAKEKLERAAEGGEKLEGIVGEVLGWIDSVHRKIQDLGPIGVKTGLIDEQIAEQKVSTCTHLYMRRLEPVVRPPLEQVTQVRNNSWGCHLPHTRITLASYLVQRNLSLKYVLRSGMAKVPLHT